MLKIIKYSTKLKTCQKKGRSIKLQVRIDSIYKTSTK